MADSKQSTDERVQVYRQFPTLKLSGPAKIDSRICFGIIFCSSEADAEKLAKRVEARGDTYNGGWLHGTPCGREPNRDCTDESGTRWYAVTTT